MRAWSSRGLDATASFPELAALASLAPVEAVLDGEVVALDDEGRPSFGRLQHRMHVSSAAEAVRRSAEVPVAYVVFDLLALNGHDLTGRPWHERRRLLDQLAGDLPPGVDVATVYDDGEGLLEAARARGLEGVVAKRRDAPYLPGGRVRTWVKVKVRLHDEMVVGGWSGGIGNREGRLGSLLFGYHDGPGGPPLRGPGRVRLRGPSWPGSRRLAPLATDTCPFDPPPPPLHRKGAHWVRPEMVVEIEYGEWTAEGRLRHPVYLGERNDKDPQDVVRP